MEFIGRGIEKDDGYRREEIKQKKKDSKKRRMNYGREEIKKRSLKFVNFPPLSKMKLHPGTVSLLILCLCEKLFW